MGILYVVDDQGRETAVLVPIKEWKALLAKLPECEDDLCTPEEDEDAAQSWKECCEGKGEPLERVIRELVGKDDD